MALLVLKICALRVIWCTWIKCVKLNTSWYKLWVHLCSSTLFYQNKNTTILQKWSKKQKLSAKDKFTWLQLKNRSIMITTLSVKIFIKNQTKRPSISIWKSIHFRLNNFSVCKFWSQCRSINIYLHCKHSIALTSI